MFRVNFSVAPKERVLVLTDVPTEEQWKELPSRDLGVQLQRSVLAKTIKEIGEATFRENQFTFSTFPATGLNGKEPDPGVAKLLLTPEVALLLTSYSITHTRARNAATDSGVRVASMPGILPEMFYEGGPMDADYNAIARRTLQLRDKLSSTSHVKITSAAGTELEFSVEGRPMFAETGLIEKYSKPCNLPAGEAACSPVEGSANGRIVVEKGWHSAASGKATLMVENGYITKVDGPDRFLKAVGDILRVDSMEEPYRSRRNIAEFGIGTNPNAKRTDITLEAEKIAGTIHIGYGNNFFMGGKVNADFHSDFVIPRPTMWFDGKLFMKNGEIRF